MNYLLSLIESMAVHKVVLTSFALRNLSQILDEGVDQYGVSAAREYVAQIKTRCLSLEQFPEGHPFDEHTSKPETYRSFTHKAHKIFYRVDHAETTVFIAAVLHGRSRYSDRI